MLNPDPGSRSAFFPSRIPDREVKKALGPGSAKLVSGIPGKGFHVLEDSEAGAEQRIVGGPEVARLQGH